MNVTKARVGDPCPQSVATGVGGYGSESGRRCCQNHDTSRVLPGQAHGVQPYRSFCFRQAANLCDARGYPGLRVGPGRPRPIRAVPPFGERLRAQVDRVLRRELRDERRPLRSGCRPPTQLREASPRGRPPQSRAGRSRANTDIAARSPRRTATARHARPAPASPAADALGMPAVMTSLGSWVTSRCLEEACAGSPRVLGAGHAGILAFRGPAVLGRQGHRCWLLQQAAPPRRCGLLPGRRGRGCRGIARRGWEG